MVPTLWNVSDSIFNVQLCIFQSWALRCNSAWMAPSSGSLLHLSALVPTKGDERGGWDGWMASPTWWTWAWVGSRSWWWTGKPGVLQSVGLQRVRHDWATELNCIDGGAKTRIQACSPLKCFQQLCCVAFLTSYGVGRLHIFQQSWRYTTYLVSHLLQYLWVSLTNMISLIYSHLSKLLISVYES